MAHAICIISKPVTILIDADFAERSLPTRVQANSDANSGSNAESSGQSSSIAM